MQEAEDPLPLIREEPIQKRPRTSLTGGALEDTAIQKVGTDICNGTQLIRHWVQEGSWPKEYFEQDKELRKHLEQKTSFEEVRHEDWFKEQFEEFKNESWFKEEYGQHSNMSHLLARQKPPPSLRRKNSGDSMTTSSDQKPREAKSAKYRTTRYEAVLETKGSFMGRSNVGVTDVSRNLCRTLLDQEQTTPRDTLFRDDLFDETCESVQARNEAMVVRDISPLICPSAQVLRIYGARHLKHLIESVNEGWNSSIPLCDPRPQPDYSVGFRRSAFTNEQLEKLRPFVGEIEDTYTSYFMGTWRTYFPFLTCEVKCGQQALDIADRQNAHSMTIAVRAVVELFKLVKREKELHREILAFSISHDHEAVRIYGHYPIINGDETTFYRHPIRKFDFTELDGKEKWTAYKFTKNVYDIWMPKHLERICSVIDEIPSGVNFDISQSELQFPDEADIQLSQELDVHLSQQSNTGSISVLEEDDSFVGSQGATSNTSFSQTHKPEFKKPRKKRAAS